jgi:hypothetical protein
MNYGNRAVEPYLNIFFVAFFSVETSQRSRPNRSVSKPRASNCVIGVKPQRVTQPTSSRTTRSTPQTTGVCYFLNLFKDDHDNEIIKKITLKLKVSEEIHAKKGLTLIH